jgi:hypothetical protein
MLLLEVLPVAFSSVQFWQVALFNPFLTFDSWQ